LNTALPLEAAGSSLESRREVANRRMRTIIRRSRSARSP
jgi:hypothetical protein